jgi:hypothetical protein
MRFSTGASARENLTSSDDEWIPGYRQLCENDTRIVCEIFSRRYGREGVSLVAH